MSFIFCPNCAMMLVPSTAEPKFVCNCCPYEFRFREKYTIDEKIPKKYERRVEGEGIGSEIEASVYEML